MDPKKVTKAVVQNAVSIGVSATVSNIVKAYVPRHQNPIVDTALGVSIYLTGWALSGTIKDPVRRHTNEQIDEIFESIDRIKKATSQK